MDDVICEQCGTVYSDDARQCPNCGAPVQLSVDAEADDPAMQLTRTLLFQARTYQQRGDLSNAIQCATDALAIRPTCSTIHTFLGSLLEQKGEIAAARRHFQKALTVAATPDDQCELPVLPLQESAVFRSASGGWMLPVLVGCLVFSGLAALFTLWPGNPTIRTSSSLPYLGTMPPRLPEPNHPVQIPSVGKSATPVTTREPSGSAQSSGVIPLSVTRDETARGTALNDSLNETGVIGPSATSVLPVLPAMPTVEQADDAYSRGAYERAAAIYEKVLTGEAQGNPHVHQHLALSYQHLGNTNKAAHHLRLAVAGYRLALDADPQNADLQRELQSCQALFNALQTDIKAPGTP